MENLPKELQLEFVDETTGEENPNFVYDEGELDDEPFSEVEHLVPEKVPIEVNDIFDESLKPILPESEDVGGLDTEGPQISVVKEPVKEPKKTKEKPVKRSEPVVKLNKNGKPRKKRQYTEEQRQAMRERMLKVRQQAGKNKQKKEEEKAKQQKYKELMEKKKDLEMEEVEEKLKKKSEPKPKPTPKPPQPVLTKQDIKDLQLEAIMQYDGLRKQRKAKKKQEQQVKEYTENVKKQLKRELGWKDIAGEYANCF